MYAVCTLNVMPAPSSYIMQCRFAKECDCCTSPGFRTTFEMHTTLIPSVTTQAAQCTTVCNQRQQRQLSVQTLRTVPTELHRTLPDDKRTQKDGESSKRNKDRQRYMAKIRNSIEILLHYLRVLLVPANFSTRSSSSIRANRQTSISSWFHENVFHFL